jgi:anti-sigma regulatory factor (Ser/Thr protein kinase)
VIKVHLPPEPASATCARQVTREHLSASCPQDSIDVAALLVTELVTNAVLHARTAIVLVVDVGPGQVFLRVRDGSDAIPAPRRYGVEAATGRGLALVEQLATAWGVIQNDKGKEVWCQIDFPVTANASANESAS